MKKVLNPTLAELQTLAEGFGNQSRIAALLNVDRSSVARWLQKEDKPDEANAERIASLWHVYLKLTRRFHPETAFKWLEGMNAHLGDQRPADLIRKGRITEVLGAIEQDETGAYA